MCVRKGWGYLIDGGMMVMMVMVMVTIIIHIPTHSPRNSYARIRFPYYPNLFN